MNIAIICSRREPDVILGQRIAIFLSGHGHNVNCFTDDPTYAVNEQVDFNRFHPDAIIFVLSSNDDKMRDRILYYLSPQDEGHRPLMIPVALGDYSVIPFVLMRYQGIVIPYVPEGEEGQDNTREKDGHIKEHGTKLSESHIDRALQLINSSLHFYEITKTNKEKEQKEKEEKVQTGLSNYLNDTMTRLKENEARNMILSYVLYALSLVPLAVSIVIALRTSIANAENTIAMAVQAIIAFFVILLFVSMSKLLFTLAKSFMVESIRCSDRIHAISFGKFFLDAYGNDVTREEVLKAFNTWNIDDGKTSFRNQSGDDYDPKLENIIAAVKDVYKSK